MSEPPLDEQGLPEGYPLRRGWELAPRELQELRRAGRDMLLLDCRRPQEHAVAHLEGAELIPMQELPQRIGELEPHRGRPIVVYCHHGMRSLRVAAFLRQQGFEDVRSLAGGIDLWARDVDPSMPRY